MARNEKTIARVQELWRNGMPQKDICKELGLSKSTVSQYVQKAPDYVRPEPRTDNHSHWTLDTETSFKWRWPFTVNLIRRRCGMDPLPVPEHNHDDEIRWLTPIKKTKRSRRTL